MALVASASQFSAVAHVLGLTAAILVIVWVVHYGGGANLNSDNTDLIFNVENKMVEKKPMTIEKKLVAENAKALADRKQKVEKRIPPKGGHTKKKKKKKKNLMDSYKIYILVHPLVMTLGFILVIGEAIMAYNTVPSRKRVQKSIHMLLHLVALGLGVLGIYAAFKFHNESQIPNMYTLHSWLGICTICLFALQWIFGFFNFWFPGAPPMTRTMLVPLHATAGLAIFLMAICTAETGFMEKGGGGPGAETRLINFTGLMILLFGLFVSLSTALPRIMSL